MSRRRILLGVGALMALVAVGLVVFVLIRPRPTIDEATKNRIQPGMTEAEVDAIIGAPEGVYTPGNFITGQKAFEIGIAMQGAAKRKKWVGEHGMIQVFFDNQGKVITAMFFNAPW
jgi:hypothetical protein